MFNDSNIVIHIKVKRLAWAGHLTRMGDERTLKKNSTPSRMEQEVLEDRNCDGRMVLFKTHEY